MFLPFLKGPCISRRPEPRCLKKTVPQTRRNDDIPDTFICPGCGEELKVGTRGCPNCAPATRQPWDQEPFTEEDEAAFLANVPAGYRGEDDFNYDAFVEREFGRSKKQGGTRGLSKDTVIGGIALLLVIAILSVFVL